MATEPFAAPIVTVAPHDLLQAAAFVCHVPTPLGELSSSPELLAQLTLDAPSPLRPEAHVADAVRGLLRLSGFKPSGRSKPASEYLIRAVSEGQLGAINPLVDACNVVSLHSGLPISVVDLDLTQGPLRLAAAEAGSRYVFNPAGQEIDIGGLLSLHDASGPIAGPVKDSQRTKTSERTRTALVIVWGTRALPDRAEQAAAWYAELLQSYGITTAELALENE